MKTRLLFLSLAISFFSLFAIAQQKIDHIKFFQDESVINVTLEMDVRDLLSRKVLDRFVPANITMQFSDSTTISEPLQVAVRGNFRKDNCYMPGLKLKFDSTSPAGLHKLDDLKMVCGCNLGTANEQLVLREYMVYKMYNLFTDKSLRVRLMKVTYKDKAGRKKPYTQYAFLIEDIDKMAKRNKMKEVEGAVFLTERTNRDQMTTVALFQYMIGNTDWSVPNYHNIKLIGYKDSAGVLPIVVPYDFDICGFVDPPYATVDEQLNISNVRDRLYRGFPRTAEELQNSIRVFNAKKDELFLLIRTNPYLDSRSKNWCADYIAEFYETISNPKVVEATFIHGARTQ